MNQVRIIGGQFRSRKIGFPEVKGLRPTHDRIRETLFNWLGNQVVEASCLDLFAGSGALGFEALSRGASEVTFVDSQAAVVAALNKSCELLKVKANIIQTTFQTYLSESNSAFDIIFLDPPYDANFLMPAISQIVKQQWLKPDGLLYCEAAKGFDWSALPTSLKLHKESSTKTIDYRLYKNSTE